jgi:hypothetical protein
MKHPETSNPNAPLQNIQPGFPTRVFMTALANNLADKPVQWVATKDIGTFAAMAFEDPEEYNQKAIGLAGDSLNVAELGTTFEKATGSRNHVAPTYSVLGSVLTTLLGEMGTMVRWFGSDGYGADIPQVRKMYPNMMDMETWIKNESKFKAT